MKMSLRQLPAAWPLVIFLLFPVLARGETADQAWVQCYNGPDEGEDRAVAVAVDGADNVIVTGCSTNSGNLQECQCPPSPVDDPADVGESSPSPSAAMSRNEPHYGLTLFSQTGGLNP